MRRLALLVAGGAVWLFLAAIPALADGGPHVAPANSGVSTLTADNCAGCHRAHTAQGALLLAEPDEEALCLSCHGAAGAGSAVDVENGIQYTVATRDVTSPVLGALRGGGFVEARINSGDPYRNRYGDAETAHPSVYGFDKKVGVLAAGDPVTSAHIKLADASAVTLQDTAWGNGAWNSGVGPAVGLSCGSCHNPHGNGQYRILKPIPDPATGEIVMPGTGPVAVTDGPATTETRNYTVIQARAGGTRYLLAGEITADGIPNTAGDYWHQVVPWDARVTDSTTANHDGPNNSPAFFNGQITAWCSTCHSRYITSTNLSQVSPTTGLPVGSNGNPVPGSAEVPGNLRIANPDGSTTQPMVTSSGDSIYNYRHTTSRNRACTTCHVAHGSNATMTGEAATFPYPDGTSAPSSRLLKVDSRGTCQLCHDPTMTIQIGESTGTPPTPGLP